MDILTLELFDVTVSQALTELKQTLDRYPVQAIRIVLESDEMVRHNLVRFLEKQGRRIRPIQVGRLWHLDVEAQAPPQPTPSLKPLPTLPRPLSPTKPLMLFRSAFLPGDRPLGRRLLLGVLQAADASVPWIGLAHDALELLDDPGAMDLLGGLQDRGTRIRISRESLRYLGRIPTPFEEMEDQEWQSLAATGAITIL